VSAIDIQASRQLLHFGVFGGAALHLVVVVKTLR
jgi:predicted membrane channel-forming protein YqfA (hemolysin III family)